MWCQIVKLSKYGVESYEARIYLGAVVKHRHEEMSEAGVRSWLFDQGIPFNKQPRHIAVARRTK